MSLEALPQRRLRIVRQDGVLVWKLQCPQCGKWGEIDADQLFGRVSVDHTDPIIPCTFHETRNWFEKASFTEGSVPLIDEALDAIPADQRYQSS